MKLDPEVKAELRDAIALVIIAAATWGPWGIAFHFFGEWMSNGAYEWALLVFVESDVLRHWSDKAVVAIPPGVLWIGCFAVWRRRWIARQNLEQRTASARGGPHTP